MADVSGTKTMPLSAIARSIRFQQHPTLTACWIWTGYITSSGTPVAFADGEQESARRVVYRSLRRRTPEEKLFVECQLPLCVNPSHVTTTRPRRAGKVLANG